MKDFREIAVCAIAENRLKLDRKERAAHYNFPLTMVVIYLSTLLWLILTDGLDYEAIVILAIPFLPIALPVYLIRKRMPEDLNTGEF